MLLTKHDSVVIEAERLTYPGTLSDPPFKSEATVSAGYTDVTSLANWQSLGTLAGLSFKDLRNILINDYVASWATLSDVNKKILVRHHVYPAATTTADLDALWTLAEREDFRQDVIDSISSGYLIIRKSSDAGSEKLLCIEVKDDLTQTVVAIATDVALA